MGETTDLSKKIGNIKRKFHSKIGRIKDKAVRTVAVKGDKSQSLFTA